MRSVPLFASAKERVVAACILIVLLCANLLWHYHIFKKITAKRSYYAKALVLNQYPKGKKQILKLQTPHLVFYTSTYEKLKDLRDRYVAVAMRTKRLRFADLFRPTYHYAYIRKVYPKDLRYRIKEAIAAQHGSKLAKELFPALVVATAMSKETRDILARYGISHLVAISGFHLGLLGLVAGVVLGFLLRPLVQKFAPFMNLSLFIAFVVAVLAFCYTAFLGYLPSLVRSFALLLFGSLLAFRGIRLLSFETLAWVVAVVVTLFPAFLFRIGFWLSVAGVFMIYLYLHHFSHRPKWRIFIELSVWVFVAMLPISYAIFHRFAPQVLLSPLLSIAFTFLYPLFLLAHIFGVGGVWDFAVDWMENGQFLSVQMPLWLLAIYCAILAAAIRYRFALLLALLFSVVVTIYQVA